MFNKIKWLILKRQAKKEGYPIIGVHENVIEKYKVDIRGNISDSLEIATLKLSRNFHSGQVIYKDNKMIIVAYGCLHIRYDRITKTIYDIINYKIYSYAKVGKIDYELKSKLNKLYRIEEGK